MIIMTAGWVAMISMRMHIHDQHDHSECRMGFHGQHEQSQEGQYPRHKLGALGIASLETEVWKGGYTKDTCGPGAEGINCQDALQG